MTTVQIDTTSENNGVRLIIQGSHPTGTAGAGHVLLYYVTGTATPGLFVKDDQGRQIGSFITGSADQASGGELVLLEQHTASSGTASLDFTTCISATYDEYLIEIIDVVPVTNNVDFYMRVSSDGGSSYISTGSIYQNNHYLQATSGNVSVTNLGNQMNVRNAGEITNSSLNPSAGTLRFVNPKSSVRKRVFGVFEWSGGSNIVKSEIGLQLQTTLTINAFRFLFSSGNFVSGTIRVYGIKKTVSTGVDSSILYPDFTTPVLGDFSWINQGGATIDANANGGLYLFAPKVAGDNLRIRKKTAPSTPYKVTAMILPATLNENYALAGICFRESSSGKLVTFGVQNGSIMAVSKYASPTSSAVGYVSPGYLNRGAMYLRIEDTGANRICSFSVDGYNFIQIHSIGRADYLTADEVGFFVNSNNASYDAGLTILSWLES